MPPHAFRMHENRLEHCVVCMRVLEGPRPYGIVQTNDHANDVCLCDCTEQMWTNITGRAWG